MDNNKEQRPDRYSKALTIAGSDSGGGAGIQADLKTFITRGVYGMSILTAATAQNTIGVQAVTELPCEFVSQQFDSVLSDIEVDAAKTGMISSARMVEVVSQKAREYKLTRLVVDPVMVAKGGYLLLEPGARKVLVEKLLPLAFVVTPNLYEAGILSGIENVNDRASMEAAAKKIKHFGPTHVVIKGGHLEEDASDLLYDGSSFQVFSSKKISSICTHGAGCTFSAAITAELSKGINVVDAVANAKQFVTRGIKGGFPIGSGHAPLHHGVDL